MHFEKFITGESSYILRFIPKKNPLVELQVRTHDLSGVTYDHVAFINEKETSQILKTKQAEFLYKDEQKLFEDKIQ